MRAPRPVFKIPREIIIEIPISQISGSANELNASLIAISAGFLIGLPSAPNSGTVTCVTATSITAIIDNAPIGIALPIIAAITPTNIDNKCQACGVTPSGTGMTNQINNAKPSAIAAGMGLKPILFITYTPF